MELVLLLALNSSVRSWALLFSLFSRKITFFSGVSIYFLSYIYTVSLHRHSEFPGSLRRKKRCTVMLQRVVLKGTEQWCCAVWGEFFVPSIATRQNTMRRFMCNFGTVHLQTGLWAVMRFQSLLKFSMVHKKVQIYNENCYSSRHKILGAVKNHGTICKYDYII